MDTRDEAKRRTARGLRPTKHYQWIGGSDSASLAVPNAAGDLRVTARVLAYCRAQFPSSRRQAKYNDKITAVGSHLGRILKLQVSAQKAARLDTNREYIYNDHTRQNVCTLEAVLSKSRRAHKAKPTQDCRFTVRGTTEKCRFACPSACRSAIVQG